MKEETGFVENHAASGAERVSVILVQNYCNICHGCACQSQFFPTTWYVLFLCMCTVCWCTWPVAGGGAAGSAEEAERSGGWAGQILWVAEGCPGEAGASREKSNRCEWRELMTGVSLHSITSDPSHSKSGVVLLSTYAAILKLFIYHYTNCFIQLL